MPESYISKMMGLAGNGLKNSVKATMLAAVAALFLSTNV